MTRCGIDFPQSVDLIMRMNEVISLVLVQPRFLSEEDALALQDKLNNYLGYIVNGSLHHDHPQSQGNPVSIRVDLQESAADFIFEFLKLYAAAIEEYDIGFEIIDSGELLA